MNVTRTFTNTQNAYLDGYFHIINKGGTRSSKSFSTLQLLYLIAKNSKKARVIHCVSHSTPHLKDGIIADFEKILLEEDEDLGKIRTQNPNKYIINKSTIKFLGFDKLGKSLGAARDILFVNEANKMYFQIVHQLIVRTTECIFYDYNPSEDFWIDEKGISTRDNAIVLHSSFKDNIQNITENQINELLEAKNKHDEEVKKGTTGYWYNYWRVYGLGLDGSLEGVIFTNWKIGDFDHTLSYCYGMDYGFNPDPLTLVKIAVNEKLKLIYVQELCYKSDMKLHEIEELFKMLNKHDLILADHNEGRTTDHFKDLGYNIRPAYKGGIVDGIRKLQDYMIVVDPNSHNYIKELNTYIWNDKRANIPIDANNHLIDPTRWGVDYLTTQPKGIRQTMKPKKPYKLPRVRNT